MAYDICIRGAGIVGRTLALMLARERFRVALVASPSPASALPDVRAYSLNERAVALLDALRCWPPAPAVTPVHRMQVWGDDGGQLQFDATDLGQGPLNWMVDVPVLEERLAQAVAFQPQIETLAEPASAPLTVICEGRASQTRASLGVEFEVHPYPHHALAARLHTERPHEGVARQWFRMGPAPSANGPRGEVLALLPLGGENGQEVALVWSVDPGRAQELLAMPADLFALELQAACGAALGPMQLVSERALWPLQQARASRWIGHLPGTGRQAFALAGDAAHAMHPLAGQGLNVGLADVAELVDVLRQRESFRELSDLRLLRRYERARQADVMAMGCVTEGLQRLFAKPDPLMTPLRNWGLKAFDHSGALKHWITRQAMGAH